MSRPCTHQAPHPTPNIATGVGGCIAYCFCDWVGPVRATFQAAAADQINHRDKCEEAQRP
jgi:hypothetical protein